ncbi:MAG: hypothetical protein Q7J56_02245 [Deltaproteobacteria bacterium]|nr:hypothetical protein [Deltaproteobacteria bacterium]
MNNRTVKSPRELAQRIAALHPPVDAEFVHTKGKVLLVGRWKSAACPQWIAEIAALIAARDEARDASKGRDE